MSKSDNNRADGAPLRRPNFPQLDTVRALAVSSVLFAHFGGTLPVTLAQRGLDFGALGVRCFYVLSGFLITTILLVNTNGAFRVEDVLKRFYARRILRIFPLYYAVLAIGFVVETFVMRGQIGIRENIGWHIAYLSDWSGRTMGLSSHFWSLCVEEQFYLAWPLALVALRRAWAIRVLLVSLAVSYLGAALIGNPYSARAAGSFAFIGTGCLLALRDRGSVSNRLLLALAGVVAAAWASVIVLERLGKQPAQPLEALSQYWQAVAFGALVVGSARGFHGIWGSLFSLRPLRYIGKISYGIYIFHLFVPSVVRHLGGAIIDRLDAGLRAALAACVTFALAALSWRIFESRLLKLKRRFE